MRDLSRLWPRLGNDTVFVPRRAGTSFRNDGNMFQVDESGSFELMNDVARELTGRQSLDEICERVGVPWQPDRLPHLKKGTRPEGFRLEDFYTSRSRELVRQAFAFELDYFGYSFPAPGH